MLQQSKIFTRYIDIDSFKFLIFWIFLLIYYILNMLLSIIVCISLTYVDAKECFYKSIIKITQKYNQTHISYSNDLGNI